MKNLQQQVDYERVVAAATASRAVGGSAEQQLASDRTATVLQGTISYKDHLI